MSKRKGVFCESCGNKVKKTKKCILIPYEIAENILSYYTKSDVLVSYEEYITLINISKSFKLAIERIIIEYIYEKDYYFICIVKERKKSMIINYYTYLRNVNAILNIINTRVTKYDAMEANNKSIVLRKNDIFKKLLDKVSSDIKLLNNLFEYNGYYGRYFLYKKDGIVHTKLRTYGSKHKLYIHSLLNITHSPVNQISHYTRTIYEKIFNSETTNEEIENFEKYPFLCYLDNNESLRKRVLVSIQEEIEKYPLIKEFLASFNSVIGGSWPLYYVLEKPKKWSPNDMDIYSHDEYRERIEEFLLSNNIVFDFIFRDFYHIYNNVINFCIGNMKFQIVFMRFKIPYLVHNHFDMDICKCFYDGKNVFTICPETHLHYKKFYLNDRMKNEETESRIKKYESRGFTLTKDRGY